MSRQVLPTIKTCWNCIEGSKPHGQKICEYCMAYSNWKLDMTNAIKVKSDGSTASYYELPAEATELQDLISFKDMNSQIGEIFRACYRYGKVDHSDKLRDAKKIKFYAEAEIARLEAYEPS